MGDPKFLRRLYDTPKHPWEAARMQEEKRLVEKYGLKNKRELWKAQSILRGFRRQARDLQARLRAAQPQAVRESQWLLDRLTRQGLLAPANATVDDVLALGIEGLLERRLEWRVFQKGLSASAISARQLIVHGHIAVGDHRVTRPGYLVRRDEEPGIAYAPTSPLQGDDHPLRVALRERTPTTGTPEAPAPAASGGV